MAIATDRMRINATRMLDSTAPHSAKYQPHDRTLAFLYRDADGGFLILESDGSSFRVRPVAGVDRLDLPTDRVLGYLRRDRAAALPELEYRIETTRRWIGKLEAKRARRRSDKGRIIDGAAICAQQSELAALEGLVALLSARGTA